MFARNYARTDGSRPAIVMAGSGEIVSFDDYERAADQVAQYLRSVGIGPGDHIAILSENCPRMLEVEAGAERSGAWFTLVNSYLAADEVAYIIEDSTAKAVFTTVAKLPVAAAAVASLGDDLALVVMDGPGDGAWQGWEMSVGACPAEPIPDERLGAAMLYSSGTTGRPKGIQRAIPDVGPDGTIPALSFLQSLWRLREGMVYLSPAPLYHSAPQASVANSLRLGGTTIVMEHFDAEEWCRLVETHRVTHSQMVPTMFSRLLRLPPEVRAGYDLSSLEYVIHAAAPCPVPVKEAMIDWVGPIILEYYAATEANGFTFADTEQWLAHRGTVGKAALGTVEIHDDEGGLCPTGVDGTVYFRGATTFVYFNDPVKTAEGRDSTGEASTMGDVGHLDDDGYLYLTDRRSYMIISGGVNIYPQETENLLSTHPHVLDVAVIGVPNEDLGEEVKAVVVADPAAGAGPELAAALIAFTREHLAHFKCPRTVDFVDELPRLPTGKLYKRVLREQYWPAKPPT